MNRKFESRLGYVGVLLGAMMSFAAAGIFSGCGRSTPGPSIAAIRTTPNPVPAGSNASITLSVAYPCDEMSFQWTSSSPQGGFNPSSTREPASTFIPPPFATPVRVTITLFVGGKRKSVAEEVVQVVDRGVVQATQQTAIPPQLPKVDLRIIPYADERGGPNSNGRISGRVEGVSAANKDDYWVVIYSKTDDWWVQPYAEQPLTALGDNGEFDEQIHTGSEYAVLLVSSSFTNALPRTPVLPRRSGQILEVVRVKGRPPPVQP